MPRRAAKVTLSPAQRRILERFSRTRTLNASLVERSRALLLASEGRETLSIAQPPGVDRQRVLRWRDRWSETLSGRLNQLEAQEGVGEDVLSEPIEEALSDEPRSGAPLVFTAEQEERVRALACRLLSEFGLPQSHWTRASLVQEAIQQGIVESVSVAEIGQWLTKGASSRTASGTG